MTLLPHRPARASSAGRVDPVESPTDLLEMAAELVITSQLGSPQMVQRKLRTSWDETQRLMDDLHGLGVVGAQVGEAPREVLVELGALGEVLARISQAGVQQPATGVDLVKCQPAELGPAVLDAEVVPTPPATRTPVRRRVIHAVGTIREKQPVRQATRRVVQSKAAKKTGRAVKATPRVGGRVTWTLLQGHVSWAKRAGLAASHGVDRQQVQAAIRAGEFELTSKAQAQLTHDKDARIRRLKDLPKVFGAIVVTAIMAILLVAVLLLAGGIAVAAYPDGLGWADWWHGVAVVLDWIGWTLQWVAILAPAVGLATWLVAAWKEGKRAANPPRWLLTEDEAAQLGAEITTDAIVQALLHVKIPRLKKALEEGAVLDFVVPPREQGGGTYFRVRLPIGVMAAELLSTAKVELLAGNLGRHKHEVWPQRDPDTDARVLDCWSADKGTLDKPAPEWPLLEQGEFDVFRDRLPWGVTMRGEPITVGMLQKHWLVGATSKQGKTSSVRVLALGLGLDVTVEFRISDLKGDGDWSMFREIAQTLIEGQSDEEAEATASMLEGAVAEMQRRYDRKRELGIVGSITREMSRRRGSGFHPIYVIVDECQVLYAAPHPIGGKKDDARAWRAAKRLHDQARAVNIHLIQATQRPDDRTLPVQVREGAHVRCSLNVPNVETARMVLAEAADRGARPQDLRPGRDAGTVVAAGEIEDIPAGMAFAIVRTHYVSTEQAWEVAKRIEQMRRDAGRDGIEPVILDGEMEFDHLAAIRDALHEEKRVLTTTVLHRLTEADPELYEEWTHRDLAAALDEWTIAVRKTNGRKVVWLEDVERVIEARDARTPRQITAKTAVSESFDDLPERSLT